MRNKGRIVCVMLAIVAGLYFQPCVLVMSVNTKQYVTVDEFLEKLGQGLHITKDENQSFQEGFLESGILVEGEEWEKEAYITRTLVAQLINRGDEWKHGKSYEEEVYDKIVEYKRIADLGKIQKERREDVIKVFLKGIMIGKGRGAYSHSRCFLGEEYLSVGEANTVIKRLVNKKLRRKLSPDGQLIRITGLPKNHKDFPYILDSFPNKYYTRKFDYEYYIGKLKEYKDYVRPVNIRKTKFENWYRKCDVMEIFNAYLDNWVAKVELNLNQRFNVDYRTIDKDNTWLNTTRSTYYMFKNGEGNEPRTKDILEYIKKVKKNKIIIKGTVALDGSSIYQSVIGYFLRARVRFQIVSAVKFPKEQEDLIYGGNVYITNLKKGVWVERIFDIGIGSRNLGSEGRDYAVVKDNVMEE